LLLYDAVKLVTEAWGGEAERDEYGSSIVHYLEPGQNARQTAFRLAKNHWRRTTDQESNDFNRPLGTFKASW
jgi:hypothetical protein